MTNYIGLDDLWFSKEQAGPVAKGLFRATTGVDLERRRLLIDQEKSSRVHGFNGPLSLPVLDLMQVSPGKIGLLGKEAERKFKGLPSYATESRVFRSVFVVCSLFGEYSFGEMERLAESLSIASPSGLFMLFGKCLDVLWGIDMDTLLGEFRRLDGHVTLATVI